MTHPLPGVTLDMSVCVSYGDPWKIIIHCSNANTDAYPNATDNANAKVLLNLFLQQVLTHHPTCFLFGWVGRCCASSSATGPLDMSVCISYGDPWEIITSFLNANTNANANAKVLLNPFLIKMSFMLGH